MIHVALAWRKHLPGTVPFAQSFFGRLSSCKCTCHNINALHAKSTGKVCLCKETEQECFCRKRNAQPQKDKNVCGYRYWKLVMNLMNSRKWRLKNISASSWKSRGCEWILKYLLMVYQWTGSLGEPGRKTAEKTRKKKSKWDNAENREKVLWVQVLQLLGEKEEWKGLSVTIVCSRGALRSPSNMAACLFQLLLGEPGRD